MKKIKNIYTIENDMSLIHLLTEHEQINIGLNIAYPFKKYFYGATATVFKMSDGNILRVSTAENDWKVDEILVNTKDLPITYPDDCVFIQEKEKNEEQDQELFTTYFVLRKDFENLDYNFKEEQCSLKLRNLFDYALIDLKNNDFIKNMDMLEDLNNPFEWSDIFGKVTKTLQKLIKEFSESYYGLTNDGREKISILFDLQKEFYSKTGFIVPDLHSSNIGKTNDGFVIRDYYALSENPKFKKIMKKHKFNIEEIDIEILPTSKFNI